MTYVRMCMQTNQSRLFMYDCGQSREDPLQEISAMQLVHRLQGMEPGEDESSRVLSLLDVLSDSNYLFM